MARPAAAAAAAVEGDDWDSLLFVEDDAAERGFREGERRGVEQGWHDGHALGLKKGAEVGAEMGFISGVVSAALAVGRAAPGSVSERAMRTLEWLRAAVDAVGVGHPEREEAVEQLQRVRAKFKVACSLLGLAQLDARPARPGVSF